MKGGTPQEFIDGLAYGMEREFTYRGRTFLVQGYVEADHLWTATLDQIEPFAEDWSIWRHRAPTMDECLEAFLTAPLFDGRTFWEAEGEMELLYS